MEPRDFPKQKITPPRYHGSRENGAFSKKTVGVLKSGEKKCQIYASRNLAPVFEHPQSETDGKSGQFRVEIEIGCRK